MPHNLKFRVLEERLAVCRLASHSRIPAWALEGKFFCVVRTRDELSVVCSEDACSGDRLVGGALCERRWLALQLEGPFPFSMTGVLAAFLQPPAAAQVPIFAIFAISTFETDYVLIMREDLERAVKALEVAGHKEVSEEVA